MTDKREKAIEAAARALLAEKMAQAGAIEYGADIGPSKRLDLEAIAVIEAFERVMAEGEARECWADYPAGGDLHQVAGPERDAGARAIYLTSYECRVLDWLISVAPWRFWRLPVDTATLQSKVREGKTAEAVWPEPQFTEDERKALLRHSSISSLPHPPAAPIKSARAKPEQP